MATDLPEVDNADGQYVSYQPDEDTLVIFDKDNPEAHVASTLTVPVGPFTSDPHGPGR